jgi:hypothetical protein
MNKSIIAANINLASIDKSRLVKGKKGTYGDFVIHLSGKEPDQYGNEGFITQRPSKEEREAKQQMPILGNVKIVWEDADQPSPQPEPQKPTEDNDELPF